MFHLLDALYNFTLAQSPIVEKDGAAAEPQPCLQASVDFTKHNSGTLPNALCIYFKQLCTQGNHYESLINQ